jgi:uncharacterized protein YecT (DUF1311 family)
MPRRFSVSAAALFAAVISICAAGAGAQAMSKVGRACFDKANTTRQMLDCARAEYRRQGVGLARLVGRIKGDLVVEDRRRVAAFDIALRRWQEWRDAECAARADLVRGGSLSPLLHLRCLADLTEQQVARLREAAE